jgi:hypothetical protein
MARHVDRKAAIRVGVAGRYHQALPVFNPPPAADAKRKTSAYAKLEQTNDDLGRELDAAKAYIAELEAMPARSMLRPGIRPIASAPARETEIGSRGGILKGDF